MRCLTNVPSRRRLKSERPTPGIAIAATKENASVSVGKIVRLTRLRSSGDRIRFSAIRNHETVGLVEIILLAPPLPLLISVGLIR